MSAIGSVWGDTVSPSERPGGAGRLRPASQWRRPDQSTEAWGETDLNRTDVTYMWDGRVEEGEARNVLCRQGLCLGRENPSVEANSRLVIKGLCNS